MWFDSSFYKWKLGLEGAVDMLGHLQAWLSNFGFAWAQKIGSFHLLEAQTMCLLLIPASSEMSKKYFILYVHDWVNNDWTIILIDRLTELK